MCLRCHLWLSDQDKLNVTTQSQIDRLNREIASLRQSDAREAENEAKATAKINRAQQSLQRANSSSAISSKLSEVERAQLDIARIGKKRADLGKKIADKTSSLGSYQNKLVREQDADRKKSEDHQRKMLREREQLERRISHHVSMRRSHIEPFGPASQQSVTYDFFICHASEDKDSIVRGLAWALQSRGKEVWYDELVLRVGDSLRTSVDAGLANSKFGVVILSKHFFGKDWPQRELDGLFGLETKGDKRILPIWHKISKNQVAKHSPMLADRVALNTSLNTAEELADELCKVLEG